MYRPAAAIPTAGTLAITVSSTKPGELPEKERVPQSAQERNRALRADYTMSKTKTKPTQHPLPHTIA